MGSSLLKSVLEAISVKYAACVFQMLGELDA